MLSFEDVFNNIQSKLKEKQLFQNIKNELDQDTQLFALDFGKDNKRNLSKEVIHLPIFNHQGYNLEQHQAQVLQYKETLTKGTWNIAQYVKLLLNSYIYQLYYKNKIDSVLMLFNQVTMLPKIVDDESYQLALYFKNTIEKIKSNEISLSKAQSIVIKAVNNDLEEKLKILVKEINCYLAMQEEKIEYTGQYGLFCNKLSQLIEPFTKIDNLTTKIDESFTLLSTGTDLNDFIARSNILIKESMLLLDVFSDKNSITKKTTEALSCLIDKPSVQSVFFIYEPLRLKLDALHNKSNSSQLIKEAKDLELKYLNKNITQNEIFKEFELSSKIDSDLESSLLLMAENRLNDNLETVNQFKETIDWLLFYMDKYHKPFKKISNNLQIHKVDFDKLSAVFKLKNNEVPEDEIAKLEWFLKLLELEINQTNETLNQLEILSPYQYFETYKNKCLLKTQSKISPLIEQHNTKFNICQASLNIYQKEMLKLRTNLSVEIERKRTDKKIAQAGETLNKLSQLKEVTTSKHQACLTLIETLKLKQIINKQKFIPIEKDYSDFKEAHLILEQQLIDVETKLIKNISGKESAFKSFTNLNKIKKKLILNEEIEFPKNGFQGVDWYIPKFNDDVFNIISSAMGWGNEQEKMWHADFEKSQSYHNSYVNYINYYLKDGLTLRSPRASLLEEINTRLVVLKRSVIRYEKNILALKDSSIPKQKQTIKKHSALMSQKLELLTSKQIQLDNEQLKINKELQKSQQLETNKIRIELLYDLNVMNVSLKKLATFNQSFSELLIQKTDINDLDSIYVKYRQSKYFRDLIIQFRQNLHSDMEKFGYKDIKIKLQTNDFAGFKKEVIYEEVINQLKIVEQLMLDSSKLSSESIKIYEQYALINQQEMDKQKLKNKVFKAKKQQELEERSTNIIKYLGDGKNNYGALNDYLTQRATAYFIKDLFTSCLEFLFKWPFGYESDQSIRQDFVNNKLRSALNIYKETGDNSQLNIVLSPEYAFFKPRTTDNSGYLLTLNHLIESLREELLTTSQQEEYNTDNQNQSAGFM